MHIIKLYILYILYIYVYIYYNYMYIYIIHFFIVGVKHNPFPSPHHYYSQVVNDDIRKIPTMIAIFKLFLRDAKAETSLINPFENLGMENIF